MFGIFRNKNKVTSEKNQKIVVNINGMHCVACSMNIDGALEDLGVISAKTSYAKGTCEVVFDSSKVKESSIISTIKELGYSV